MVPAPGPENPMISFPLPLYREVIQQILKWGALPVLFGMLLVFVLVRIQGSLDVAVAGHAATAELIEKHNDTTKDIALEMKELRALTNTQNKAIIRLLELGCLKTAETYTDRRDCQQAREGMGP